MNIIEATKRESNEVNLHGKLIKSICIENPRSEVRYQYYIYNDDIYMIRLRYVIGVRFGHNFIFNYADYKCFLIKGEYKDKLYREYILNKLL